MAMRYLPTVDIPAAATAGIVLFIISAETIFCDDDFFECFSFLSCFLCFFSLVFPRDRLSLADRCLRYSSEFSREAAPCFLFEDRLLLCFRSSRERLDLLCFLDCYFRSDRSLLRFRSCFP